MGGTGSEFKKNNRFLSFITYPMVIVLHLESFENNLFELDFSISKKRVCTVKRSQEGEYFLHGYKILFRDSCFFSYIKTLLKLLEHVFEKNPT